MKVAVTAWIQSLQAPGYRRHWRLVLIALLIVVLWFAFKPSTRLVSFTDQDKVEHVLAFATLAVVACLGWASGRNLRLAVAVSLLGYGLFIELVQTQLPTRSGSVADLAADALGIALGLWLSLRLRAWAGQPDSKKTERLIRSGSRHEPP